MQKSDRYSRRLDRRAGHFRVARLARCDESSKSVDELVAQLRHGSARTFQLFASVAAKHRAEEELKRRGTDAVTAITKALLIDEESPAQGLRRSLWRVAFPAWLSVTISIVVSAIAAIAFIPKAATWIMPTFIFTLVTLFF